MTIHIEVLDCPIDEAGIREEVRAVLHKRTGLLRSLTKEQLEEFAHYDGEVQVGRVDSEAEDDSED